MTNFRKGQVRLGPRTWAIIREAYLNGASAASLAETYGCSLGTIRYRAVREGWRRCDVHGEGAAAPCAPAADPCAEPATPQELLGFAIAAAGGALRAGRPSEAAAYVRVAEALQRLGEPQGGGGGPRPGDPNYITPEELAERAEAMRARASRIQALLEERCGASRGGTGLSPPVHLHETSTPPASLAERAGA